MPRVLAISKDEFRQFFNKCTPPTGWSNVLGEHHPSLLHNTYNQLTSSLTQLLRTLEDQTRPAFSSFSTGTSLTPLPGKRPTLFHSASCP